MNAISKGWKPGREPWCWQPKAALRLVREALDAENAVASGLLVYFALTEIASDKQSQTFQTTHSFIAMRSGLSPRTVQQRIQDLTDIGVLKCVVPNLRAPATYTLLSNGERKPLPSVTQQMHNDKQPLPSVTQRVKKAPLPTLEESPEESGKKKAYSTKASKLSQPQKEIADELETVLGNQWANDAGKWVNRIKSNEKKVQRIVGELKSAIKEKRVTTTPAQYAEQLWKEFK